MEAHLKLIEMLEQLAETAEKNDTQWGKASALQARLFTKRFPKETSRGAMALVSAARACEAALLFDDARKCFTTLEHDFGKTPFAEQQAGAIRRYKLAGSVLEEFAGATIDGGFLSVDQFRGQPVLIVFWSCASPAFQQDIPRLKQLIESFGKKPFTILGVNLDTEESIVDSYLSQVDLPWRTIFSASPDQRGLKNPIARFYGVTTAGQYWVVDDKGTVLAAPVAFDAAAEALKPFAKR
jgi:peroxiredoxin